MPDVVIIGAGPAGIAAAIQLKRGDIDTLILEQNKIGGLLASANLVENYPGFPGGISGPELVGLLEKQLHHVQVSVSFERVTTIDFEDDKFISQTERRAITSAFLIIATGTKPKNFAAQFVDPIVNDRVFNEISPLLESVNQRIAIIGAGDAAFDYALNLARRNTVIVLNRTNKPSCLPLLYERCLKVESISYRETIQLMEIGGDGGELALRCVYYPEQQEEIINVDYVLTAIGREPNLDLLGGELSQPLLNLRQRQRLFLIGDVHNGRYRQTGICVGDGLKAAMQINEKLSGVAR